MTSPMRCKSAVQTYTWFLIHEGHARHPYEQIESGEGRHPYEKTGFGALMAVVPMKIQGFKQLC